MKNKNTIVGFVLSIITISILLIPHITQAKSENIKSFTRQKAYEFAVKNNLTSGREVDVKNISKKEFDIEKVYGTNDFVFIKTGVPKHVDVGVQPTENDDYYTFHLLYFLNGVPTLVNNSTSGQFNPGMPFGLSASNIDSSGWWASFRQKKVAGGLSFYSYRGDDKTCSIDEWNLNKQTKEMEIGDEIQIVSKVGQNKCGLLDYFLGKKFKSQEDITFTDIIDFALERGFVTLSEFKKIHDSNSVSWDSKKKSLILSEFKKTNTIKFSFGKIVKEKLDIENCNSNSNPSLTLISPNGGETYTLGDIMKIKWSYCNLEPTSNVVLTTSTNVIEQGYPMESKGTFLGSSSGYPLSKKEYSFEIPKSSGMGSGNYRLKISCILKTGKACEVDDVSDDTFIINRPKN